LDYGREDGRFFLSTQSVEILYPIFVTDVQMKSRAARLERALGFDIFEPRLKRGIHKSIFVFTIRFLEAMIGALLKN
jgi:hypothetical protein